MKKPTEEISRIRLTEFPELELEYTERVVHLSPTVTGRVYALRGVASSDVDIVITDDAESPRDDRDALIAIVSKKSGKYDGAVRDRLLLRRVPGHQARDVPAGIVYAEYYGSECDLVVAADDDPPTPDLWRGTYRAWTHELTDTTHAGAIPRWHWRRYYSFLPEADLESYAACFGERAVGLTLAEANRLASRELYAMARAAGWRKLTLREQQSLGLEGQWHRDEVVAEHRASRAARSGCGEHTLLSATMAEHLEGWLDSRAATSRRA
jgi:hypothetical protein